MAICSFAVFTLLEYGRTKYANGVADTEKLLLQTQMDAVRSATRSYEKNEADADNLGDDASTRRLDHLGILRPDEDR